MHSLCKDANNEGARKPPYFLVFLGTDCNCCTVFSVPFCILHMCIIKSISPFLHTHTQKSETMHSDYFETCFAQYGTLLSPHNPLCFFLND
jgi:hypothetical protein